MIVVFCIRWADTALVVQTAAPYVGVERDIPGIRGCGVHAFATRDVPAKGILGGR